MIKWSLPIRWRIALDRLLLFLRWYSPVLVQFKPGAPWEAWPAHVRLPEFGMHLRFVQPDAVEHNLKRPGYGPHGRMYRQASWQGVEFFRILWPYTRAVSALGTDALLAIAWDSLNGYQAVDLLDEIAAYREGVGRE